MAQLFEKEIVFGGSDISDYILIPAKCRLEEVYIMSTAAITADGANYLTLKVYGNDGAAVVADRATSSVDLAQLAGESVSIDGDQDKLVFEAGEYVKIEIDETGTFASTPTIHFALKCQLAR